MNAVMVGCEARLDIRSEMLVQLAYHGVTPELFISPCDGKTLRIYDNWKRALDYAVKMGQDVLLLEDDGIIADYFGQALRLARTTNAPCYLYINEVLQDDTDENKGLYPAETWDAIRSKKLLPLQAVKLRNVQRINSTLATYLPYNHLVQFHQHYTHGNLDSQLCRWLDANDIDTYSVLPHAVQHRQGKSFFNGDVTRSKSASFGLFAG